MSQITIEDLYDAKFPNITFDMVEHLDVPDVKQYISDHSVFSVEMLVNLPARELTDMLCLYYNRHVNLMVAQTVMEESKEYSSVPPSELNEGFFVPQEVHQSAVQIRGPHPQ
jgi:hypothetical protein